jgi:phenylpropionate dioxygenase-like ring-hydroxylating dioxygenase large terminal subunit
MALTRENQETLIRTNAGTPMGELFRRYWIPALLAEELPEPDCPPVRVRLLGEDLVAFRDSEGRLGLIDQFCPHRGVSLFFARNEECGLRCSYHGWKFDVTGQCVDMPSEPEESNFKNKVKITSYPLMQLGDVLWAYMGPPEAKPELPAIEWATLPASQVYVSKRLQRTNYLQALEGGIDSSHVSFTHKFSLDDDPLHAHCEGNAYLKRDGRPRFEVVESDAGLLIGARRNADEQQYYWRITQYLMPWYTIIPPFGYNLIGAHAWVPIDDENCWAWSINYHPVRDLTEQEVADMRGGAGIHVVYKPGTYEPVADASNDYLIDRKAQKERRSFSGVKGIAMQDASLQESAGRIQDRTRERLGTSDTGIIMARQRLLRAAKALANGEPPPGLDPAAQQVRSASLLLAKDVPFQEGAAEVLRLHPHEFFATL